MATAMLRGLLTSRRAKRTRNLEICYYVIRHIMDPDARAMGHNLRAEIVGRGGLRDGGEDKVKCRAAQTLFAVPSN